MPADHEDPVPTKPAVEKIASLDEVKSAIETLSKEDCLRLRRYAWWRIRGLGYRAEGTGDDLLQEALRATLEGDRRWKIETVNFMAHLVETMRSISSNWRAGLNRRATVMWNLEPIAVDPEMQLIRKENEQLAEQALKTIEDLIAGDILTSLIFIDLQRGMSRSEILADLHISETEYATARKRLYRAVRDQKRWGNNAY